MVQNKIIVEFLFIYLGGLHHFQHCTGHMMIGSFAGTGTTVAPQIMVQRPISYFTQINIDNGTIENSRLFLVSRL